MIPSPGEGRQTRKTNTWGGARNARLGKEAAQHLKISVSDPSFVLYHLLLTDSHPSILSSASLASRYLLRSLTNFTFQHSNNIFKYKSNKISKSNILSSFSLAPSSSVSIHVLFSSLKVHPVSSDVFKMSKIIKVNFSPNIEMCLFGSQPLHRFK